MAFKSLDVVFPKSKKDLERLDKLHADGKLATADPWMANLPEPDPSEDDLDEDELFAQAEAAAKTPKRRRTDLSVDLGVVWNDIPLARQPTKFEAEVLDIPGIVQTFEMTLTETVEALLTLRRQELDAVSRKVGYTYRRGRVRALLREAQTWMAEFGAAQVRQECARQGVAISLSDTVPTLSLAADQEDVLQQAAEAAAQSLDDGWEASITWARTRLQRAKRARMTADDLVKLATKRETWGLKAAARSILQLGFVIGRQAEMRTLKVRRKRLADGEVLVLGEWEEDKHPRDASGRFAGGMSDDSAKALLKSAGEGEIHEGRQNIIDKREGKLYRGFGFKTEEDAAAFLKSGDLSGKGVYDKTTFMSPDPDYSTTYMSGKVGVIVEIDPKGLDLKQARGDTVTTQQKVTMDRVTRMAVLKAAPDSSLWGAHTKTITSLSVHLADEDLQDVADLVDYVVQSAILDKHTCSPCGAADGKIFQFGSDEQLEYEPPYYDCDGADFCRCLQIAVITDYRDRKDVEEALESDRVLVKTEKQAERMITKRQGENRYTEGD